MTRGDRIKKIREQRGMQQTDLAARIDVSKQTLFKYEHNIITNIPSDKIELIADVLGVDPEYIMGWQDDQRAPDSDSVLIPVYGRVAAGEPIDASQDNIIGYEKISQDMARRGTLYALQIKGDSMEPRFFDGDTIIVRAQPDAESGEIVVATINGDDATCKKLYKLPGGGIQLHSLNPAYEPFTFDEETVEELPVRILGKVLEMRSRFA